VRRHGVWGVGRVGARCGGCASSGVRSCGRGERPAVMRLRLRLWLLAVGVLCTVVALVAAGSAGAAVRGADASSPKPKPVSRCAVPRGWSLLDQDAQAIVIKRRVKVPDIGLGQLSVWTWRYCLSSVGRFQPLIQDVGRVSGYFGDVYSHRSVVLSGLYVAYQTLYLDGGGRYDCKQTVTSYNLLSRRSRDVFDYDCFDTQSIVIGPVLVNARGFVAWRVTDYPESTYTSLGGVSCPAVSLCVTADAVGNILTATEPTGGRGAWAFATPAESRGLPAASSGPVSCPTIDFCVVVGSGMSFSSTDPTGGAGAWLASPMPQGSFTGLSCASASLCVAVGGNTIATSTDPTSATNAWTQIVLPGAKDLQHVSCPSESLCVAVDFQLGEIFTSTDPAGGPSAWKTALANKAIVFQGISCPSISLCVAVAQSVPGLRDEVVTSRNPVGGASAWRNLTLPKSALLRSISCVSGALCLAVGGGDVFTSTDPTGGVRAWKVEDDTDFAQVDSVSCPSTSLCVATTHTGLIATSTNPAAGAASWTFKLVDAPDCAFATPCVAQQLYASDSHGTRQLDSTPPGSTQALADLQFKGDQLTWTHNGAPRYAQFG
jgi:hypothetical protein